MIEFSYAADTDAVLSRLRDRFTIMVEILPGRQALEIARSHPAMIFHIDSTSRGPEAFHIRWMIRLFRERLSCKKFRLIVYFNQLPDNDAFILEGAAKSIEAGMDVLIVETCDEENASWRSFLAKHLSILVSEARHAR